MIKNEAIGKEKVEFAKTLAGISSTLAAICLAILIFSLGEENVIPVIRKLLWWAVILFAVASFTCLDVLMDAISDMDENYTLKEIHKDYLVFDKRITGLSLLLPCFSTVSTHVCLSY